MSGYNSGDYSRSKPSDASAWPVRAVNTGFGIERTEKLLTPAKLRSRFFRGLPLVSPLTNEPITNAELKDDITQALNSFELESGLTVTPAQHKWRLEFDAGLYKEYLYLECPTKPILSIERLAIESSDQSVDPVTGQKGTPLIYQIPPEWIEAGNFHRGRINVIPLTPAFGATVVAHSTGDASGVAFLNVFGSQNYLPAFWTVAATCGLSEDGNVPISVNRAIGLKASIMTLQNLIPQNQYTSYSLAIDGVSQNQQNQAAALYTQTLERRQEEYDRLLSDIKLKFRGIISTYIG